MTSVFFFWWRHHFDTADLWAGRLHVVLASFRLASGCRFRWPCITLVSLLYFKTDLQIVQYLHTCDVCLSYRLFLTFLLIEQRLSPAKNFNSPSVFDENKSPWLSTLQTETENSLRPREWQSQTVSCLLMVFMYKYVIYREKCNVVTFQDVWWVRISITMH